MVENRINRCKFQFFLGLDQEQKNMCLASTSRTAMFSEQWLHMRRTNYFGAAVLAVRFASKRVDWAFVNLMPPAHTIEH